MIRLPSRVIAAAAVAVLALVITPTAASAAGGTVGGVTFDAPVPLPIGDLDASFVASNESSSNETTRDTSTPPYWANVGWYTVTPAETVTVYIRATSIAPEGWDNALEVWTAAGELVGQNDDSYDLDAALTVTLEGGTEYRIGLAGFDAVYRGTATLTFSTRTPSAPGTPTAVAGDGQAEVAWTAPTDAAGGITDYRVLCTPAGGAEVECGTVEGTPPSSSLTVTGLTNGTSYTFRVAAANDLGWGETSTSSDPVTPFGLGTTTTVSIDPEAPVSGQSFTVTATVTQGSMTPSGTVDFLVGSVATASVPLVDGVATVTGVALAGEVDAVATYSGATGSQASTGSTTFTVGKRAQTVTIEALPALVFGMAPVTVSAWSQYSLPVTVEASGACAFEGAALSLTGVGACTLTASALGDAETLPATATLDAEVAAPAMALDLVIDAALGDTAADAPVSATGTGLLPGSDLVLEVRSTPQRIGAAVVAADGTATVTGMLPALEPGDHQLVALGTSVTGESVTVTTPFTVSEDGALVAIDDDALEPVVDDEPAVDDATVDALAETGADPAAPLALALVTMVLGAGALIVARRRALRQG